jgi:hypothetical protein
MIRKVVLSFALAFASLSVTQAQFSDGTYKGQVQLTKDVERIRGADRCIGTGTPFEFRVSGTTITLTFRPDRSVSGPLAGDGSFQLSAQHPAGQTGKWITTEWKGKLTGSNIAGNSVGRGPGRDCSHSFAAKKVGSLSR